MFTVTEHAKCGRLISVSCDVSIRVLVQQLRLCMAMESVYRFNLVMSRFCSSR